MTNQPKNKKLILKKKKMKLFIIKSKVRNTLCYCFYFYKLLCFRRVKIIFDAIENYIWCNRINFLPNENLFHFLKSYSTNVLFFYTSFFFSVTKRTISLNKSFFFIVYFWNLVTKIYFMKPCLVWKFCLILCCLVNQVGKA